MLYLAIASTHVKSISGQNGLMSPENVERQATSNERRTMKKITIEVDRASDAQIKTLLADLSIQMEPWQRYIKYKIKNGNRTYKRQALTIKPQA